MVYEEDDFLLLSGIQHFVFCKRQWALIHIEQQWDENELTIEGQNLHKKADEPFIREKRKEKLIIRGMPVKSYSLGTSGICDVVEFTGHVFSTALGDPWVDVNRFTVISTKPKDENK